VSADFSALHEPLVEWVYDRTRADPLGKGTPKAARAAVQGDVVGDGRAA
jgi:hypothetical protein